MKTAMIITNSKKKTLPSWRNSINQITAAAARFNEVCGDEFFKAVDMLEKNPHAQALGKLGGSANTPAQNQARAKNAKKGGWPKGRKRPAERTSRKPSKRDG
jgi:hypothetical protein